jgi:DNA polymerase-3 subunit alpha
VPSVHPLVDDILAETHGIMVYQEQVMQVLNGLGKLPLNTALTLIKAISKKKEKVIAAERPKFLAGAKENNIPPEEAEKLFDLILRFAGYGFNKAHSTRYAIVAYQTAYFKVYHPREFMAALLTFESGDTDKVVQYLAEAQRMDITVRPPDINASGADFTVDGRTGAPSEPLIRFGLTAVKGVGHKAAESIIEARGRVGRFQNLYHFCENVDLRVVNRATIEALVKCGAFDALGAHRAAMLAALDRAVELGNAAAEDRRNGQLNFFDGFGAAEQEKPAPRFPSVEPLSEAQLLQAEKATLGFYVTSHPLVKYGRELDSLGTVTCATLADYADGTEVTLGCMISSIRTRVTKSGRSAGKKMAILNVEDLTGSCVCIAFAEAYQRTGQLLTQDAILFLTGSVDRRRETPQLLVNQVIPIEQATEQLTGCVTVRLDRPGEGGLLSALGEILQRHRGGCPVVFQVTPVTRPDIRAQVRPARGWFISPSRDLYRQLCQLLGQENVVLQPRRPNGPGANGSYDAAGRRFHGPPRSRQRSAFAPSGQGPG